MVDCFLCIDAAVIDAPYDAGVDVPIDSRDGGGDGLVMDGRTEQPAMRLDNIERRALWTVNGRLDLAGVQGIPN